jgi:class 3 adenylate cyclase/tetratricopeptide (TPR) repeat protein
VPLCPHCGEDNPDRARFCLSCGAQLARAASAATEFRKIVTILFTDVTGSTSLGERLDPESLRGVMGRYFDAARTVVDRHGGTVEKFIGDAVMAVFGIPVVHEDDALRAVRAAVELNQRLTTLDDELEELYGVRLELRTGVYTGEVAVGAGEVFATGDAVNVAARLEQAAAPGEILIGEPTRRLVRDAVEVDAVAPLELKGKSEPVPAWRLRAVVGEVAFQRRLDSPLIGRERELAAMCSAHIGALRRRTGGLLTVLGPAGIGKSRVVREFVRCVEPQARVLVGHCLPYGEGITYWPVADVVREAAGIVPELSAAEAVQRIEQLVRGEEDAALVSDRIAGAIGLAPGGAPPQEIFWAVRRLVESLARAQPLVLVFDDVHWAEPTFLDLVEHLVDHVLDSPVLILCTARPELLESRPGWGGDRPGATAVRLEPLTDADSARLIDNLEARVHLDAALRARIVAAADGNPLYVEEMLAMIVEDGAAGGDVTVPPTIQALLSARLDRLAPEERDVTARASVVGQEFSRSAVAELVEGTPVDAALRGLVAKDVIRPAGEEAYGFRHLLIRDAAYASVPKRLRAELHERYARHLERDAGERLSEVEEILGYHLEQAYLHRIALGPPDEQGRALASQAARHLHDAGVRADARGDLHAAAALLQRALDLREADDPARPEIQALLGATLLELGEYARAGEQLAAAEAAAGRAGDRAAELSAGVAASLMRARTDPSCDLGAAADAAEAATRELDDLGAGPALVRVWRAVAALRLMQYDLRSFEEAAEQSVEQARRFGQTRGEAEALYWLCLALSVGPRPVPEGIRRCEELLEEVSGPLSTASVLIAGSSLHALAGDLERALDWVRRGRAGFADLGFVVMSEAHAQAEGMVLAHAGDFEAAEEVLRRSSEALDAIGETVSLAMQLGVRALALARLGRIEESLALSRRVSETAPMGYAQVLWRQARSYALSRTGEHEEALALAREAVRFSGDPNGLHGRTETLENLAAVAAAAGETDEARRALEEGVSLAERKGCVVCTQRLGARLESLSSLTA